MSTLGKGARALGLSGLCTSGALSSFLGGSGVGVGFGLGFGTSGTCFTSNSSLSVKLMPDCFCSSAGVICRVTLGCRSIRRRTADRSSRPSGFLPRVNVLFSVREDCCTRDVFLAGLVLLFLGADALRPLGKLPLRWGTADVRLRGRLLLPSFLP